MYRVLKIPRGQDKDAQGRGVGDDWLIASCGSTDAGEFHVTTDRVRCSEYDAPDAEETAQILVDALNRREVDQRQMKLEVG